MSDGPHQMSFSQQVAAKERIIRERRMAAHILHNREMSVASTSTLRANTISRGPTPFARAEPEIADPPQFSPDPADHEMETGITEQEESEDGEEEGLNPDVIIEDIHNEEEREAQEQAESGIIVATDFGTTFSSVSFTRWERGKLPMIESISNYERDPMIGGVPSLQVPTESCYPDIEKLREAEEKLAESLNGEEDSADLHQYGRLGDSSGDEEDEDHEVARDPDEDMSNTRIPARRGRPPKYPHIPYWGYGTREALRDKGLDEDDFCHIERSKLLLATSESTAVVREALQPVLKELKKKKRIKKDDDVIADFLTQLFCHTKKELETTHGVQDTRVVEHVLCIPNVWNSKAIRRMQAAIATAIRKSRLGTFRNFFLVTEPEAAAAYVVDHGGQVNAAETFVIIDAGGGTVDVTTYSVKDTSPLRLEREAVDPIGGLYGSSYLNENYIDLLKSRLAEETYLNDGVWSIDKAIEAAAIQFERTWKRILDVNNLPDKHRQIHIQVHGLQDNEKKRFRNGGVLMREGDWGRIFWPLLKGICELLADQLCKLINKDKDHGDKVLKVMLVGGFSGSPSLVNCLKKNLKQNQKTFGGPIRLINVKAPVTAIAHGAILRSLNKSHGPGRNIHSSYGFLKTEPYEPTAYPAHAAQYGKGIKPKLNPIDGVKYMNNTIDWLIKTDTWLPPQITYSIVVYHVFEVSCEKFMCEEVIYVSDSKTAESHYWVGAPENEGAEVAGKVVADMTFLKTPNDKYHIKKQTPDGKEYYYVKFKLAMIVEGRNLRFAARWPLGKKGETRGEGQISIAAAFRPGTK